MTLDPKDFKKALSKFASGVTVVTCLHKGEPIGITVSSFSSLSLEPPLVLVSLAKKLFTHQVISESGAFAVNILSDQQRDLGMRFAGMVPDIQDRFAGLSVQTAVTGCPLLPDTLAWLDCRVWNTYAGGDHTIFVGEVVAVSATDRDTPLLYHGRDWRRSAALEIPSVAELAQETSTA